MFAMIEMTALLMRMMNFVPNKHEAAAEGNVSTGPIMALPQF